MSEPHILKIARSGRPAAPTKGGSLPGLSHVGIASHEMLQSLRKPARIPPVVGRSLDGLAQVSNGLDEPAFLRSDLNHEALVPHVETVEFHGKTLKLVSKRKLLEIKLSINPPRPKDQIDIDFLRRHV